jgi:hypothetical protein
MGQSTSVFGGRETARINEDVGMVHQKTWRKILSEAESSDSVTVKIDDVRAEKSGIVPNGMRVDEIIAKRATTLTIAIRRPSMLVPMSIRTKKGRADASSDGTERGRVSCWRAKAMPVMTAHGQLQRAHAINTPYLRRPWYTERGREARPGWRKE